MDDVIGLSQEENIVDDVETSTAPENQDAEAEDSFRARSADVWQRESSGGRQGPGLCRQRQENSPWPYIKDGC